MPDKKEFDRDSISNTLIVAIGLSLVCSIIVSSAAIVLKPVQEKNEEEFRQQIILDVAGLMEPDVDINVLFESIDSRMVDLETGSYTDEADPDSFDALVAACDKVGMSVFGHVPRNFSYEYSLSHGLDVIAHAEELYFTWFGGARDHDLDGFSAADLPDLGRAESLIALLLEHDVAVIPGLIGGFAHMVFYDDDETTPLAAEPKVRVIESTASSRAATCRNGGILVSTVLLASALR